MSAKYIISTVFLIFGVFGVTHGKFGFKGEQEWGFSKVREGSYMFYWLHYTTANVSSYTKMPLLMWLQGGPGVSSTGNGNFEEIGPFNLNLTNRKHTLVKNYNILFIDSPVGTGYSYIDSNGSLANSDDQVAKDLLTCISDFTRKFPSFLEMPTYIYGESYGGKIAAYLASEWLQSAKNGSTIGNLKGVALASAWISPIDSTLQWAPYLYTNGLVDLEGYENIMSMANETRKAVQTKKWKLAYEMDRYTLVKVFENTVNLNLHNILFKVEPKYRDLYVEVDESIKMIMETHVKSALNLSKTLNFNIDKTPIRNALKRDFMKPATKKVEYLLKNSEIDVFILNGQLDLLVNIPGTLDWIHKLYTKNLKKLLQSERRALVINNIIEGYVKSYGKLKMHWVNRAGHMVTTDNPAATRKILKDLAKNAFMK